MTTPRTSPSAARKLRTGVLFGGRSPEHEVSVISALQAAAALDRDRFTPVPVYVSKQGRWYTGEHLLDLERYQDLVALIGMSTEVALAPGPGQTARLVPVQAPLVGRGTSTIIDVAFLGFHGGSGENGAIQGLCEALSVPYTGSGVLASALGMDKAVAKRMCRLADIPVVPWHEVWESAWRGREDAALEAILAELPLPLIVKPVRLGSSIGIAKATTREELEVAVEDAFRYDVSVLVETCVPNLREINASVLGHRAMVDVSVLEEPVAGNAVLSFQDKYQRDSTGKSPSKSSAGSSAGSSAEGMASLDRLIPAPLSAPTADRIRTLAREVFLALDCAGVARIDFLMDAATDEVFFNEINTIPGSFSFYLWDPAGVPFPDLLSRMIDLALERHEERQARVQSYDINLLEERAVRGLKG